MGRKNVRTDDPVEPDDVKILEVVLDLEEPAGHPRHCPRVFVATGRARDRFERRVFGPRAAARHRRHRDSVTHPRARGNGRIERYAVCGAIGRLDDRDEVAASASALARMRPTMGADGPGGASGSSASPGRTLPVRAGRSRSARARRPPLSHRKVKAPFRRGFRSERIARRMRFLGPSVPLGSRALLLQTADGTVDSETNRTTR